MTGLRPGISLGPADADRVVVWLHGLGADCHDFEPVVPMLGLSGTRFVFPQAENRPVTINGGWIMPAWYDIRPAESGLPREDDDQIRASAAEIAEILDAERAAGARRLVVMGFSQGAAMALHVGLRYPAPLAGIGVLSGYLVMPAALAEAHPANAATPTLHHHGAWDDVVPVAWGKAARDAVAAGRAATWHTYGMGHELCAEQLADLAGWLTARLR